MVILDESGKDSHVPRGRERSIGYMRIPWPGMCIYVVRICAWR